MVLADATTDKLSWPAGDAIRQTIQADKESGLHLDLTLLHMTTLYHIPAWLK